MLLCLAGCAKSKTDACLNKPQYQALTQSAKEWLPYSNTKSVVFEDANLARDTLEIARIIMGDEEVWVGDKCPVTRGQFVKVDFFDDRTGDSIKTQLGYEDELRIFTRKNHILYYDTKKILVDPAPNKRFELSKVLNGKTFLEVLVLDCTAADNCDPKGITTIYFSKSKGLAGFVRNGKLWTLY